MVGMFRGRFGGGVESAFDKPLVKRASFKGVVEEDEWSQEDEKLPINPPRYIKMGVELDPHTGEEIGDFYLPFDNREQEPACIVIGGAGSGKSTCITRVFSELAFDYGRSVLVLDSKNQYKFADQPNDNPKHLEILATQGESPRGIPKISCFVPQYIIEEEGEQFCMDNYSYTSSFKLKIGECKGEGLLLLGGKDTEGKTYVNLLISCMALVKRRDGVVSLDALVEEIEAKALEKKGYNKSADALIAMLDSLVDTSVIGDKGTSVTDMMHEPKPARKSGELFVFNVAGAGPDDPRTKGMLVCILNGMSQTLKTQLNVQPVLVLEEASTYFGKDSSTQLKRAFNNLHYVVGRSLGIFRIYVYQRATQIPNKLLEDEGISIVIECVKNFTLRSGEQMVGSGIAKVHIKNTVFMPSNYFLVKVTPPKCKLIS